MMLDPVYSILIVWLTLFGACIGSFLNVVVYRLPLGKSLSDPPSHCPKCNHRIRWHDNVPVFGWCRLGGKCRDCKEKISFRYPLVEFLSATIFGVIAWLLVRRIGDASLNEFVCLSIALSGLCVTFLAAGLIEWDGNAVPWKLFVPAAVMGPMVPYLYQDAFCFKNQFPVMLPEGDWNNIFLYLVFGLLGTAVVFWVRRGSRLAWIISGVLLGLYFGLCGIAVLVFSIFYVLHPFQNRTVDQNSSSIHLFVTILVFGMIVVVLTTLP